MHSQAEACQGAALCLFRRAGVLGLSGSLISLLGHQFRAVGGTHMPTASVVLLDTAALSSPLFGLCRVSG